MKNLRAVFICSVIVFMAAGLCAQDAAVSFRTGELPATWCPIVDENSDPFADGYYIGIYLTGADNEVDPPSGETLTWGEPTDDDVHATGNSIGNGLDHLVMGFNEPPFIPDGNLFTGNGAVAIPPAGTGTEPVVNQGDRGYLRAFNAADYSTATHYNNIQTLDGATQNWFMYPSPGPITTVVCFTTALPILQGPSPCEPIEVGGLE